MDGDARQRREALFASIAGAKGGAAGQLLSPEVVAAAQAHLDELKPLVTAEVQTCVDRILILAERRMSLDDIFAAAHDVRGMAAAYGFASSGVAAAAIRAYGENRPEGFEPDWSLLRLLAQTLTRTFVEPQAVAPPTLAAMCREAVAKVMAREARELPEGAL